MSLGRTPISLVSIHPYQNQDRTTFGSSVIVFKSRPDAEIKSHQIQDAWCVVMRLFYARNLKLILFRPLLSHVADWFSLFSHHLWSFKYDTTEPHCSSSNAIAHSFNSTVFTMKSLLEMRFIKTCHHKVRIFSSCYLSFRHCCVIYSTATHFKITYTTVITLKGSTFYFVSLHRFQIKIGKTTVGVQASDSLGGNVPYSLKWNLYFLLILSYSSDYQTSSVVLCKI